VVELIHPAFEAPYGRFLIQPDLLQLYQLKQNMAPFVAFKWLRRRLLIEIRDYLLNREYARRARAECCQHLCPVHETRLRTCYFIHRGRSQAAHPSPFLASVLSPSRLLAPPRASRVPPGALPHFAVFCCQAT
jgi:hypothetical protein